MKNSQHIANFKHPVMDAANYAFNGYNSEWAKGSNPNLS